MEEIPVNPQSPLNQPQSVPVKTTSPWMVIIAFLIALVLGLSVFIFYVVGKENPFQKSVKTSSYISPQEPLTVDTTGWNTYVNSLGGFTLKYPQTVQLDGETKDTTALVLRIGVEKVSDIPEELPLTMGRANIIALRERLEQGGEDTVKIELLNGLVRSTHSQFEVCSVMFVRRLTFFQGDYRIILSLIGPEKQMEESMPEFFVIDEKNCGKNLMWNTEKRDTFDDVLKRKEGKGMAQAWYDTFDEIVSTISLIPQTSPGVTKVPSVPQPSVTSGSTPIGCDVSNSAFCNIISDLKQSLTTKNYASFLSYQTMQSTTCDPDGMYVALCEGETKGTVKQGYTIGYNQSEGTLVDKAGYISTLTSYVASNGPFVYRGSLVSGEKAVAVFLNSTKDKILVFPMKQAGATWRGTMTLLGGDFGGQYTSLSQSIL